MTKLAAVPIERDPSSFNAAYVVESSPNHACGVTTTAKQVNENLRANGHQVTIIAPGPGPDQLNGSKVFKSPSLPVKGFHHAYRAPVGWMDGIFNEVKPDISIIASPMATPRGFVYLGGRGVHTSRKKGVPIIEIYQTDNAGLAEANGLGILRGPIEWQMKGIHNRADLTLAPSPQAVDYLESIGVRPESIKQWARGVATKTYNPDRKYSDAVAKKRQEWDVKDDEVVVGWVGRLTPEKCAEILDAITDMPNVKIIIVGEGPSEKNLHKLFAGKNVVFTGELLDEDLADAYASFDIFAFTGTKDTFGQVIQEAKATGIPVVVARAGGPISLVEHGETGFLYDTTDPNDFRGHIARLVGDVALRKDMGAKGRASVEHIGWDVLVRELEDHARDVIERHSPSRRTLRVPLLGSIRF